MQRTDARKRRYQHVTPALQNKSNHLSIASEGRQVQCRSPQISFISLVDPLSDSALVVALEDLPDLLVEQVLLATGVREADLM